MADRRTILKLLGIGCVGAFGIAAVTDDQSKSTDSSTSTQSDVQEMIRSNYQNRPERYPDFDFNYGSVQESINDPYFSEIIAEAAPDQKGDQLRIRSSSVPADELAILVKNLLTVKETTSVSTSVDTGTITMDGGSCDEYSFAALVGTHEIDGGNEALIARGKTLSDAEDNASNFN